MTVAIFVISLPVCRKHASMVHSYLRIYPILYHRSEISKHIWAVTIQKTSCKKPSVAQNWIYFVPHRRIIALLVVPMAHSTLHWQHLHRAQERLQYLYLLEPLMSNISVLFWYTWYRTLSVMSMPMSCRHKTPLSPTGQPCFSSSRLRGPWLRSTTGTNQNLIIILAYHLSKQKV